MAIAENNCNEQFFISGDFKSIIPEGYQACIPMITMQRCPEFMVTINRASGEFRRTVIVDRRLDLDRMTERQNISSNE